jgi:hypothetical protein
MLLARHGLGIASAENCKVMFPQMAAKLLNAWPTHLDIRINTSMVNKYIDGESIGQTSSGRLAHQKWSGR